MEVATLRARQLALPQAAGLFVVIALAALADPRWRAHVPAWALVQGAVAALVARGVGAPSWWQAIHLLFLPLAAVARALAIAPGWYLAAFIALLVVFWRTDRSRVPLYLSNAPTADAFARLLPERPCRIVDLGCGTGGLLRHLARVRPDCALLGVEHAPLPWLWARVAASGSPNLTIRYGDLWDVDLAAVDVVYAFLSPVPMSRLWTKACAEMRADALLVSNSFPVPDVNAEREIAVGDRRGTRLFCYRLPGPV